MLQLLSLDLEGVIDRQNATWNIIDFIKIRVDVSFLNNKE